MQMVSPIIRIFLLVAGTAGYLGLAVLGWGSFAAFFSHPALTAVVVIQCGLALAGYFAGGNLSKGVKEDRGNRWVLAALILPSLLQAYLPAWTDRHEIWCVDGDTVRWVGVVLLAAGGILRLWPVFVLGNRFSGLVAIQEEHTLVTNGIYRKVSESQLFGLADRRPWLEPRIPLMGRRYPDGPDDPATGGANGVGRATAARSLRRRV